MWQPQHPDPHSNEEHLTGSGATVGDHVQHPQYHQPKTGSSHDIYEVVDPQDEPRDRDNTDDNARESEPHARQFVLHNDERKSTPHHRTPEGMTTRKPWPLSRRDTSEHPLKDRRNPLNDGWITRSWWTGEQEKLLEYPNEGDIREQESKDEQATPSIDPPPRKLVASDVEHAT